MKHRIDANEFMELSCRVESLSRRLDCFSRSDMTVVMDLSERVKKLETLQKGYKNVMTSSEAAEYLGISRKKIYDLVRTKNLPFFKPNNKLVYFERSELIKWIRSCRVASMDQIESEAARIERVLALK